MSFSLQGTPLARQCWLDLGNPHHEGIKQVNSVKSNPKSKAFIIKIL